MRNPYIKLRKEEEMNLIDRIYLAMSTDEENIDKQTAQLVTLFTEATPTEKAVIDKALICICGWSITSLLEELTQPPIHKVRYQEITTYQIEVEADSQEEALSLAKNNVCSDDSNVLDASTDYYEIVE